MNINQVASGDKQVGAVDSVAALLETTVTSFG